MNMHNHKKNTYTLLTGLLALMTLGMGTVKADEVPAIDPGYDPGLNPGEAYIPDFEAGEDFVKEEGNYEAEAPVLAYGADDGEAAGFAMPAEAQDALQ